MANYPQELAQDAAYQSHTSHLTELWSLPKLAQGLNTFNNNNNNNNNNITRLTSNEIFSTSDKIHKVVGRAKDLSAPLYIVLKKVKQISCSMS
jgi:hypothetical protein